MKNRSRSATVDGSGQGTSWQEYVCSFISLETLVFEKRKLSTTTDLTLFMLPPPSVTMSEVTPVAPAYLSSHDSQGHNSRKKKKKLRIFPQVNQVRVHTFRTDQNSMTFSWHKFKFPWQYQNRKFYEFSKKNISGPNILASSWNVKFPDIFAKFHFSLTHHRIPW